MAGRERFRSEWQSLIASQRDGVEASGGSEHDSAGAGKGFLEPESATAIAASSANMRSTRDKARASVSETGHGMGLKPDTNPSGITALRDKSLAGRVISGSPLGGTLAAKDTAAIDEEEPAGQMRRAGTEKCVKAGANDTVDQDRAVPAPTALVQALSAAQTLNPVQPSSNCPEDISRTASGAGDLDGSGARSSGLLTESSTFATGRRSAGLRSAEVANRIPAVAIAGTPAQGLAATPTGEAKELQPSSDGLIKEVDPHAAGASVKGNEVVPAAAPKVASVPGRNEAAADLQARETTTTPAGIGGPQPVANDAAMVGGQTGQSRPAPLIAGKAGSSAAVRTPAINPARLSRAVGGSVAANRVADLQPGAAAPENSNGALSRDLSGFRGRAGSDGTVAGDPDTAGEASRNTFSALDAEAGARTPAWLHAGANRAEAGYQDPVLGWVSVRADVGASGIHASVVPASMDAAQALGGHLSGLNTHLAAEHLQVETLTVAAPESRDLDAGMGHGSSQNTDQGAGQGAEPNRQSAANAEPEPVQAISRSTGQSTTRGMEPASRGTAFSGGHISIVV
jgi:hypothetical protein